MKSPTSHCRDKDWLISQMAPDKGIVSISKEIEPLVLIKKNSQMNCCIGEESNDSGDWSVNLPEPSPKQRLANKNYHSPQRKGSECTGRKYCLKHKRSSRTRNLSGENSTATEYTSETFSKSPLQLRGGLSHVKDTRHLKSGEAAELTCEGCRLPGRLSGRQWERYWGVYSNPCGWKCDTVQILSAQNGNSYGFDT